MKILQVTPGAGGMYCGGCFRDNALVAAWRKLGHDATMVPLYLPMTLDEDDQSHGTPIFFGGINVYLRQKAAWVGRMPTWFRRALDSPRVLRWAAGSAAKTRAADVGELTVSMLRGEEGRQSGETAQLVEWLKTQSIPDVICLSNALLVGMVRHLKRELDVPVVVLLSGEDTFLDGLPEPHRALSWRILQERAQEVDLFIAPTRYFRELMESRLRLDPTRLAVVPNGINLDGFVPPGGPPDPPVLGYFARMCKEKGLDTLVEAFIRLKERDRVKGLRLRVGGGLSPTDEATLVKGLRGRLQERRLIEHVDFHPNLTRAEKLAFYRSLSVLSVPALYGEAFGLYVIEAWASGVPVVQPRHAAFPELIELSGAGVLCEPGNPDSLAVAIEELLLDPQRLRSLGHAGRAAAAREFNIGLAAERIAGHFSNLTPAAPQPVFQLS